MLINFDQRLFLLLLFIYLLEANNLYDTWSHSYNSFSRGLYRFNLGTDFNFSKFQEYVTAAHFLGLCRCKITAQDAHVINACKSYCTLNIVVKW